MMEEYLPISVAGVRYYIQLERGREPIATRNWEPDEDEFEDEWPPPYCEGEIY